MKTTSHLIPLCFFLLASIYAKSLLCTAAGPPVLDRDNNELQVGTRYVILSRLAGGSFITLASVGDKPCPLSIAQQPIFQLRSAAADPNVKQIPAPPSVVFYPEDESETVVRVSTLLNIHFVYDSQCAESTTWRVNQSSAIDRDYFIITGGEIGNPGCETMFNWFKIVPAAAPNPRNIYKFVFSPEVCLPYRDSNITSVYDSKQYRLYADVYDKDPTHPLLVTFLKATRQNHFQ